MGFGCRPTRPVVGECRAERDRRLDLARQDRLDEPRHTCQHVGNAHQAFDALIGVPSPVLWGVMTAVLRFVPYVGVLLSAAHRLRSRPLK
jgi:hypothetical protein